MREKFKLIIFHFIKNYYLLLIGLVVVFLHIFKIIEFSNFIYQETDARWWLPVIEERTAGLSWTKVIAFVFSTDALGYASPYLRLQPYLVSKFVGNTPADFITVSIFFHLLTSISLFYLCRQLKFDSVTSLLSGLLFFSYFIHFHAYVHAIAFQHNLVAFFMISILYLYYKTNDIYEQNGQYNRLFLFTLFLMLLSSFTRTTILIVPLIIFFDILINPEKNARKKYYLMWMPAFFIYLLYQSFFISKVGDDHLENVGLMFFSTLQYPINFIGLLFLGSILIFLGYLFVQASGVKRKMGFFVIFAGIIIILFTKTRYYYFIVPFISFIEGFFLPINAEMSTKSLVEYHKILADVNIFFVIVSFLIIIQYIRLHYKDLKTIIPVLIVYSLWFIAYPTFLRETPSKYFIYITPFLIIVVVSVLVSILDYIKNKGLKKCIVVLFLLCFSIQNTIAVRVSMFRGKIAHNLYSYDYAKFVNSISEKLNTTSNNLVYVENLPVLPFEEEQSKEFLNHNFLNVEFITLKYIVEQELQNIVLLNDNNVQKAMFFDFNNEIDNDLFQQNYKSAISYFRLNDYERTMTNVDKALEQRPYLMNWLLGVLPNEYLKFLTDGMSLSEWLIISRERSSWSVGDNNNARNRLYYLSDLMNEEITNYQELLLIKIYLMFINNNSINNPNVYIRILSQLDNDITSLKTIAAKWQINDKEKNKFIDFLTSYKFIYTFNRGNNYFNSWQSRVYKLLNI